MDIPDWSQLRKESAASFLSFMVTQQYIENFLVKRAVPKSLELLAITNRRNRLCSSVTSISKGGEMEEDSNFFLPHAAASFS